MTAAVPGVRHGLLWDYDFENNIWPPELPVAHYSGQYVTVKLGYTSSSIFQLPDDAPLGYNTRETEPIPFNACTYKVAATFAV